MKKSLGLILLTLGIGITAGTGSQLSPEFKAELTRTGDAQLRKARSERRQKAYCRARKSAGLKLAEGCSSKAKTTHLVRPERLSGVSETKRTGRMIMALEGRNRRLPEVVAEKRARWIKALKKERSAHKRAEAQTTQGPGARLSGWAAQSGFGFGLGLLLVFAGALICRRAIAAELMAEGPSGEDGPVDFGALLGDVCGRVAALHQEMVALEAPTTDDLDALKAKLEDIQKGDLARLCESGPKVQQRYGMAGFAQIFSPLSAGERKLNRLWSTLVDRHWPEALASAADAVANLRAAQATVAQTAAVAVTAAD
jgi:hypothetical protein